jgi:hypothetical protein
MNDPTRAKQARRRTLPRAMLAILLIASTFWLGPVPFSEAMRSPGPVALQAGCPTIRDGDLLQADGPAVYLVEDDATRLIPDFATFRAMGFDTGAVNPITAGCLAVLPAGPPLPRLVGASDSDHLSGVLTDNDLRLTASSLEVPLGATVTLSASIDSPGAGDYSLVIQRSRGPGGPSGGLVSSCRGVPTCSGQFRAPQAGAVSFLATLYRCDSADTCTAERSSATVTVVWR